MTVFVFLVVLRSFGTLRSGFHMIWWNFSIGMFKFDDFISHFCHSSIVNVHISFQVLDRQILSSSFYLPNCNTTLFFSSTFSKVYRYRTTLLSSVVISTILILFNCILYVYIFVVFFQVYCCFFWKSLSCRIYLLARVPTQWMYSFLQVLINVYHWLGQ